MRCLCMGEVLLRYSTAKGVRIQDLSFQTHVGGSETNIAVSLVNFGHESFLFSKVSDNALGDGILQFLRSHQVDTQYIVRSKGRVGCYYLEVGSGNRASKVLYDRADSAMTSMQKDTFDVATICKDKDVFIVSGITMALGKQVQELIIDIMKYCQKHGILVVYDSNYRANLWSQKEAGDAMRSVLPYVSILSAGLLDGQYLLSMQTKKTTFVDQLTDIYGQIQKQYPNIRHMVSTQREIMSASVNRLTGYHYCDDTLVCSKTYTIDDIMDRVGAGDAFISGCIHALLQNKDSAFVIDFGCSASVLKHSIIGDVNTVSEAEVLAYMENAYAPIQR